MTKARARRRNQVTFLAFLLLAIVLTTFICVEYLRLKKTYQIQTRELDQLQAKLISLREENKSLEGSVNNSISMNQIRDRAIHDLGMHLPDEDQIIHYQPDDRFYVQQYRDVDE